MNDYLMPGIPRNIAEYPDMETVERIRSSITEDSCQVVDSDMLLPCPFCGGKPYIQVYELSDTCIESRVICRGCHVSTSSECQSWRVFHGDDDLTRTLAIGRAISSWNRRAERTCRMVRARWDDGECVWGCRCTACGDRFTYETGTTWRYCPACGAKVVE